jgi:alpha-ribazole phosphatase
MEHEAIPLTAIGHKQAIELVKLLPSLPSAVYTSPFQRAHDTALAYCSVVGQTPQILDLLREFVMADPSLLSGMTGAERRPIADAHWDEADPHKRLGARAETFFEFQDRVESFLTVNMNTLPDGTVIFGHGQWLAMLFWKLLGLSAKDSFSMKTFRRFQLGFPMPNCAVYRLIEIAPSCWKFECDEAALRQSNSIKFVLA